MIPTSRRALIFHGSRIYYAEGWRTALEQVGLSPDADWTRLEGGLQVSASKTTNCFRIVLDDGGAVYFKRYVYARSKPQFYYPMPSKAAVENFGYQQLRTIRIPTLDVLAVGELRCFGALRAACIVTREIPDSTNLEEFAASWFGLPEPEFSRVYNEISEQILQQARTAHQHHFYHRDLKWRNIVIQETAGGYLPVWIDCPKARYMPVRRRRGRLIDLAGLARLAISYLKVRDQLRALRTYLDGEYTPGDAKRLYRDIEHYLSRRFPELLDIGEKRAVSLRLKDR